MESANKPKEAKARGSTQGSWRAILGDLAAHAYLESCKSFADFNYINFLYFTESQRLTKDQCEVQWNDALEKLMTSSHEGLRRKAISLKKRLKSKDHTEAAGVFWAKVKRKRKLDKGTLEVQSTYDEYWNKRILSEMKRDMNATAETSDANVLPAAAGSLNHICPAVLSFAM
ncbi:hypothetical protein K457DRAFT_32821 [Linnemannia elongata AG-77]|uniref:Uncharacterized protein n=1 Tax=Linnemannia elongata AG-77 TaxID=1314771 RepID=A0A197JU60_9FUNG|nr:hypothetical protein K457DRAFT_32821 [Linnemannia elongata AG-77]